MTRTTNTPIWFNLAIGAFAAVWIGLIVSAAVSVPVVGFVAAIPATLVVYVLRAAVLRERNVDWTNDRA